MTNKTVDTGKEENTMIKMAHTPVRLNGGIVDAWVRTDSSGEVRAMYGKEPSQFLCREVEVSGGQVVMVRLIPVQVVRFKAGTKKSEPTAYTLLEDGDHLQEGDEFLGQTGWRPVEKFNYGCRYTSREFRQVRRPVTKA